MSKLKYWIPRNQNQFSALVDSVITSAFRIDALTGASDHYAQGQIHGTGAMVHIAMYAVCVMWAVYRTWCTAKAIYNENQRGK